jgi:hypothetical protein
VRRCRIEHRSTNAASVRSFGERETVKVTIPEALGDEHGRSRRRSTTVASAIALQRWRRCSYG